MWKKKHKVNSYFFRDQTKYERKENEKSVCRLFDRMNPARFSCSFIYSFFNYIPILKCVYDKI